MIQIPNLFVTCIIISITSHHHKVFVSSFTSIPLQCSLREPKQPSSFQFNIPQIPFLNNVSGQGQGHSNAAPVSSKKKNQLQSQSKTGQQDAEKGSTGTNNSDANSINSNGPNLKPDQSQEIKKLETRTGIMQHALQFKSSELDTMTRRNTLLQDVVKKLHVSNRNLLDKVHQLQHEKEGMHIGTESEQLWPPEMEIEVLREEINSKEMEWQNTLDMAQWKYSKLRDDFIDVNLKLRELMTELSTAEEKAMYHEERAKVDDDEIVQLKSQIEEKEKLLKSMKLRGLQEEGSKHMESKIRDMEQKVEELEKQNDKAKEFINDLREQSKMKRLHIQTIVVDEREKNRTILENLKSKEVENVELRTKLNKAKKDLNASKWENSKRSEEAKNRKKEEEERAKMVSKESLDIATGAVRQAEARELDLQRKLKKANDELDKTKEENVALRKQVNELQSSIEEEMEQYDQSMELLAVENDWKLQTNELITKLKKTRDSRDVVSRQGLRLQQSFDESRESHKLELKSNQAIWEQKMVTQKMEYNSLVQELRAEIISLNKTMNQQELEIKELCLERDSLKLSAVSPINDVDEKDNTSQPQTSKNFAEPSAGKPKKFQRIRTRVSKLKKWLKS